MRTQVLKVYTGPTATEHPDESFETNAVLSFLNVDAYIDSTNEIADKCIEVSPDGQLYTSYERWIKIKWNNDDSTTISNLRICFHGTLPQGVYLRAGYSEQYMQPTNAIRTITDYATYNFGGPNEINPDDPTTYLHVPVHKNTDDTYSSDYIVVQLVADSQKIPLYDFLKTLALEIVYEEV